MTRYQLTLWITIFVFSILPTCLPAKPTEKASPQKWEGLTPGNAVWIWETTKALINDPEERRRILAFCEKPPGGAPPVKTLFLYAGWKNYLKNNAEKFRGLLKEIHSQGMKVHYLDGTPEWAFNHRHFALRKISRLANFNRGGDKIEQFDGIHFDVEPYLLKKWRNPEVVQSYKEHLSESIKAAHKANLPLGIALPNFYDSRHDDLLESVIKMVDYVALMNYKDNSTMMVDNARVEIEICARMDKPIWLGVETQKPTRRYGVTMRETFFEDGYMKMEQELKVLKKEFATIDSVYGIAYHHLGSYRELIAEAQTVDNPKQDLVPCNKINGRVHIDGNLEEWTGRPRLKIKEQANVVYSIEDHAWKDVNDLSGSIFLGWNVEAFYVCGKIIDDAIIQEASGTDIWRGDHSEIWIDTELNFDPARKVYNEHTFQFGISPGNFDKQEPDLCLWLPKGLNDKLNEIKWASQPAESGYSFEVRIPWAFIKVDSPEEDFQFRVNIDISDTDTLDKEQKVLMSTSTTRIFSDPTTFRTVVLAD